jgi:hypothetical protein
MVSYHFHRFEPKICDFGLASKELLVSPGHECWQSFQPSVTPDGPRLDNAAGRLYFFA